MPGERSDWFPTSIWHFDLPDSQELNHQLLSAILAEKSRDGEGLQWSNALGWHSRDNLNLRPEFQGFVETVRVNAREVAEAIQWDLRHLTVVVNNCWGLVNGKFASNFAHNHPNSLLSGVYYIQAPENCGGLFFRDPREVAHMFSPPVLEVTPWTLQKVTYRPLEGRMILFPSWIMHGVEPNLSDGDRVCLSFNIGLAPVASKLQ